MTAAAARGWSFWGGVITALTLVCAVLWAFPLYWGVITSLKPEDEVVRPYIELWPDTLTFQHYVFALTADADRRAGTSTRWRWRWASTVITIVLVDAVRLRHLAAALSAAGPRSGG